MPGDVEVAVRRELEGFGQVETVVGVLALFAAARLDRGRDSGSGVVALSKLISGLMVDARAAAPVRDVVGDLRDELARQRAQRRLTPAS